MHEALRRNVRRRASCFLLAAAKLVLWAFALAGIVRRALLNLPVSAAGTPDRFPIEARSQP
jgi:hypothetical protein